MVSKGYGACFGGNKNILKSTVGIVTQICEYTKTVELSA